MARFHTNPTGSGHFGIRFTTPYITSLTSIKGVYIGFPFWFLTDVFVIFQPPKIDSFLVVPRSKSWLPTTFYNFTLHPARTSLQSESDKPIEKLSHSVKCVGVFDSQTAHLQVFSLSDVLLLHAQSQRDTCFTNLTNSFNDSSYISPWFTV